MCWSLCFYATDVRCAYRKSVYFVRAESENFEDANDEIHEPCKRKLSYILHCGREFFAEVVNRWTVAIRTAVSYYQGHVEMRALCLQYPFS